MTVAGRVEASQVHVPRRRSWRVDLVTRTSVDITIPVLNEKGSLVSTLTTLAAHSAPSALTIGASPWPTTAARTDVRTRDGFRRYQPADEGHSPRGARRGRALKQASSTSTADVVAYMDVDLSTGLESLRPLLDPVVDGRCEVSIGSRAGPRRAEITRAFRPRGDLHVSITCSHGLGARMASSTPSVASRRSAQASHAI